MLTHQGAAVAQKHPYIDSAASTAWQTAPQPNRVQAAHLHRSWTASVQPVRVEGAAHLRSASAASASGDDSSSGAPATATSASRAVRTSGRNSTSGVCGRSSSPCALWTSSRPAFTNAVTASPLLTAIMLHSRVADVPPLADTPTSAPVVARTSPRQEHLRDCLLAAVATRSQRACRPCGESSLFLDGRESTFQPAAGHHAYAK